ncbi:hypothetical protein M0R45_036807 [Rubus argutus]|uniref:Uncharacterized protein n=1 Tax=Rubus argutus TaxID=59490 RepID=A0AAW1VZV5_RUBAR
MVSDFLCATDWDLTIIQDFFTEDVKQKILGTHAGGIRSGNDKAIWNLSTNGEFTVKSAYQSLFTNVADHSWPWNFIWHLQIPPKVKVFLWTLVHGRLLTNESRMQKGLAADAHCPRCSCPIESMDHIFKGCNISITIWTATQHTCEFPSTFSLPFYDWLLINLKSTMKLQYDIPWGCFFAVGLWYIWKWRCSVIFDPRFKLPVWTVVVINHFTREYFEANKNRHPKPQRHTEYLCWKSPTKDWHKLNVDGSLHKGLGIMCAGGVIRNDKGEWMNDFAANLGSGQVLEAELWGLIKGMDLAWNCGYRSLEIEMDSLVAVHLVLSPIDNSHPLFSLVVNCQELLERDWRVILTHVYRERNSVADMMASLGHCCDHGCRTFTSPPSEVIKLYEADLLGFTKPRLVLS